jgi:hypothetical protein
MIVIGQSKHLSAIKVDVFLNLGDFLLFLLNLLPLLFQFKLIRGLFTGDFVSRMMRTERGVVFD